MRLKKLTRRELIKGLKDTSGGLSYVWTDKNDLPHCNWTDRRPTVGMILKLQHEDIIEWDSQDDIYTIKKNG